MNKTTEELQAAYTTRFIVAAICVIVGAGTAHLILLGYFGNYIVSTILVVAVFSLAGWTITIDLCARHKQLKQLRMLQEHGPYDRREYVPPHEAARQIGDTDGRNMWGTP
jgi:hypothetical protein